MCAATGHAANTAEPVVGDRVKWTAGQTKMTVRHVQGESMEKTLAWAESEVEGFLRT